MSQPIPTVVGIDVGGQRRGFHAVALSGGNFVGKKTDRDPAVIVGWCLYRRAAVVAVDAPCRWSQKRSSREAERLLGKQGIHCFATPTRERALPRDFYKWVFNGEKLYECLTAQYLLFSGQWTKGQMCIETFPHAIVCAVKGKVVSARFRARVRREVLRGRGCDDSKLPNIDFVDAALCAVAADAFQKDQYQSYGNTEEGFIIVPGR